jgi:capsular exopolysaccharide synthesis family protein
MKGLYNALKKAGREPLMGASPAVVTEFPAPAERAAPEPEAVAKAPDPAPELRLSIPGKVEFSAVEPGLKIRTVPLALKADSPVLRFDSGKHHVRAAEEYRIIRTRLVQHPAEPRLMVVSSPGPGDGKTINAINLTGALALKTDRKVLLVDGDLRRAGASQTLGILESPGLGEVLSNTCRLEDALVQVSGSPSFYFLPAGRPRSNPAELLESYRWKALCDELREQFRFTVVDAPPVAAVADYELLQAFSDGVILVLRVDHSHRAACRTVFDAIPDERLLGVIVNCPDERFLRKSANYYYYYSNEI